MRNLSNQDPHDVLLQKPVSLLLVADDGALVLECRETLAKEDLFAEPVVARSAAEAMQRLTEDASTFQAVILAEELSDSSGLALFQKLRDAQVDVPVLFLVSNAGEGSLDALMQAEVDEFVLVDPARQWQRFLVYFLRKLVVNHAEHLQRKRFEEALAHVATGISATVGRAFFNELTTRVAQALGVRLALVGELRGERCDRVRTLSVTADAQLRKNFDLFLQHGPCERIAEEEVFICANGLKEEYPNDPWLRKIGAESFIGVALRDRKGTVQGLLAVVDSQPAKDARLAVDTLHLFAERAVMEIERLRSEAALEVQARVLEQIGEAVICFDLEGHIQSWNKGAEDIFACPREEALGRSLQFIYSYESYDFLSDSVMEALLTSGKFTVETPLRRNDGEEFTALVALGLERTPEGEAIGLICSCNDVSRERQAEDQQRSDGQRLSFHLRHSPLAYVEWNREKKIVAWNPAAEAMFGYADRVAVGNGAELLFNGLALEQMKEAFERMRRDGLGMQIVLENRTEHGVTLTCEWSGTPMLDAQGSLTGWATMARDLTEQMQAEKTLKASRDAAASASRAKDDFISMMSHEVRTPMHSIIGFTDLLLERATDDEQRESLEIIKSNSNWLLELLNNLLYYSRLEADEVKVSHEPTDLGLLIHEVQEVLDIEAKARGIKLECEIQPDIPAITLTDHTELRQALLNTLRNAIQCTATGTVLLSLYAVPEQENSRYWNYTFAVRYAGDRDPEDNAQRLFLTFGNPDVPSTRRYGGTGLGLAITRKICHLLGGEVCAEEIPGKGYIYYLYFPLRTADKQGLQKTYRNLAGNLALECPLRILVMEINPAWYQLASRMVKVLGYEPLIASDKDAAMRMVQDHDVDVVLVAFTNDEDEAAFALIEQIRTWEKEHGKPPCKLVVLTGFPDDSFSERCHRLGANAFLHKPLTLHKIAVALQDEQP